MKLVFTVGVPFIHNQLRFPFACVTAVSHVCCCISDRNKGNENIYLIFNLVAHKRERILMQFCGRERAQICKVYFQLL